MAGLYALAEMNPITDDWTDDPPREFERANSMKYCLGDEEDRGIRTGMLLMPSRPTKSELYILDLRMASNHWRNLLL
ncbi:hypothetical protein N7492_000752 [Penicillium capsulatum]|uniref:Uncharacterized protein n=1 Tax=Penicillium capsulatum TaxID=69766 RepID=A0A9W9IWH6_9EURO|nr:hypothetical protein N7492_000752 [Penicillium capsulatum]KAJ6130189.1 hypothetical protein N7512_002969 [Penicillium capsulatum]